MTDRTLFDWEPPTPPNYRRSDPATSKEAGDHARSFIHKQHAEILAVMRAAGRPMAAEEIGDVMGCDHVAINRRLPELERAEAIERTAERHKNRSGREAVRYRVRNQHQQGANHG